MVCITRVCVLTHLMATGSLPSLRSDHSLYHTSLLLAFFCCRSGEPLVCPACQQPLRHPEELPFWTTPASWREQSKRIRAAAWAYDSRLAGGRSNQWHISRTPRPFIPRRSCPDLQPWCMLELDQRTNDWYIRNMAQHEMYYQFAG